MGDRLAEVAPAGSADKAVSSLVPAPVPPADEAGHPRGHAGDVEARRRDGVVGDYGLQRTVLMRLLFRQVQMVDGFDLTEPNAQGVLPSLMDAGRLRRAWRSGG